MGKKEGLINACIHATSTYYWFPAGRYLLVKPAYSRQSNSLGTKLLTMYAGNAERDLPTHNSIVLVFNPATGILQAVSQQEGHTLCSPIAVLL